MNTRSFGRGATPRTLNSPPVFMGPGLRRDDSE